MAEYCDYSLGIVQERYMWLKRFASKNRNLESLGENREKILFGSGLTNYVLVYFTCHQQVCKNMKNIFERFSLDDTPEGLKIVNLVSYFRNLFRHFKMAWFYPKKDAWPKLLKYCFCRLILRKLYEEESEICVVASAQKFSLHDSLP